MRCAIFWCGTPERCFRYVHVAFDSQRYHIFLPNQERSECLARVVTPIKLQDALGCAVRQSQLKIEG